MKKLENFPCQNRCAELSQQQNTNLRLQMLDISFNCEAELKYF